MDLQRKITLWKLVERMQEELDSLGLRPAEVDHVVMRRMRAYLQRR